jgi:DNA-binding response OmpR family regulator
VAAILIIEDDQRIRQSLSSRLAERGHEVDAVGTAMSGVEAAVSGGFDVVVLDLGLPDVDGAEALRMIRAVADVPVIVATARDDETEIVRLLDAGADDYVVKPYSAEHLEARLRAVLRRSGSDPQQRTMIVGEIAVSRSNSRRASSNCSSTSLNGPVAWSASANSSRRYGASPTEAPTRPLTCTFRGSERSSEKPQPSRGTSIPVAALVCA